MIRSTYTTQLRRPIFVSALALLALNDHVLKGAGVLPTVVTGKLSDLAGLFVAPLVLVVMLGLERRRAIVAAHAVVGGVFSALKLLPACAVAFDRVLATIGLHGHTTVDATDLLALPMLLASYGLFFVPRKARPAPAPRFAHAQSLVVLAMALLFCAGSSTSLFPPSTLPQSQLLSRGGVLVIPGTAGDVGASTMHAPPGLDCERLLADPSRVLPTIDFSKGVMRAGYQLPFDAFESTPPLPAETRCDAVMIIVHESTWFGIGSDELPTTYVVWDRKALAQERAQNPDKASSIGTVRVVERDTGLRLEATAPIRLYLAPKDAWTRALEARAPAPPPAR